MALSSSLDYSAKIWEPWIDIWQYKSQSGQINLWQLIHTRVITWCHSCQQCIQVYRRKWPGSPDNQIHITFTLQLFLQGAQGNLFIPSPFFILMKSLWRLSKGVVAGPGHLRGWMASPATFLYPHHPPIFMKACHDCLCIPGIWQQWLLWKNKFIYTNKQRKTKGYATCWHILLSTYLAYSLRLAVSMEKGFPHDFKECEAASHISSSLRSPSNLRTE